MARLFLINSGGIYFAENVGLTPPVISFSIPAFSTNLSIPITSLNVSDDLGPVEYAITTNSQTPTVWTSTKPTTISVASSGQYLFYLWAKDSSGNIVVESRSCAVSSTFYAQAINSFSCGATFSYDDRAINAPLSVSIGLTTEVNPLEYCITSVDITSNPAYTVRRPSSGFQQTKPISYEIPVPANIAFGETRTIRLFLWTKDASNNYSSYNVSTTNPDGGFQSSVDVVYTKLDYISPTFVSYSNSHVGEYVTQDIDGISFSFTDIGGTVSSVAITDTNDSSGAVWVNSPTWTASDVFTTSQYGNSTIYCWAKDSSDNISLPHEETIRVNIPDAVAPTVDSFTLEQLAIGSLQVRVTEATASDNVKVEEYLISEVSDTPAIDDARWLESVPLIFVAADYGTRTYYLFAKDVAGNISAPLSASVYIASLMDLNTPVQLFGVVTASAYQDVYCVVDTVFGISANCLTGNLYEITSNLTGTIANGWYWFPVGGVVSTATLLTPPVVTLESSSDITTNMSISGTTISATLVSNPEYEISIDSPVISLTAEAYEDKFTLNSFSFFLINDISSFVDTSSVINIFFDNLIELDGINSTGTIGSFSGNFFVDAEAETNNNNTIEGSIVADFGKLFSVKITCYQDVLCWMESAKFFFDCDITASIVGSETYGAASSSYSDNNTVVCNTLTTCLSTYSNFAFNSYFTKGTDIYGIKNDGVFLIGAQYDAGSYIQTEAVTPISSFGKQGAKACSDAFILGRFIGQIEIVVVTDEQREYSCLLTNESEREGLHRLRVKIPKGIKGSVLQYKIRNVDGNFFSINNLEVILRELQRAI